MDNAKYNTSDVKRVCETKLSINFRDSKEFNGWYMLRGKKVARITVSKGKKDIKRPTYKNMANQLKLSVSEFDDLLACPLDGLQYKGIIEKKVII